MQIAKSDKMVHTIEVFLFFVGLIRLTAVIAESKDA